MSRELISFVGRRFAAMAVLLVVVSFAVFSLAYLTPGDPLDAYLGSNQRTPQTIAALRHQYHLDQPFLDQYWTWAKHAVVLNFGKSIATTLPVSNEIESRLPTSLYLGLYAYVITMVAGVGFGVLAALRRRRTADRAIVGAAVVGLSTPPFVSGILLLYLFAVLLGWFPAFGAGHGFVDAVWHLTLPALALALVGFGYILKHTRAAVMGVLDQDYVTFAQARGLSPRRVLVTYVLRNALIPVVTISGLILAFVVTGAVLVENAFNVPGIGQLLVSSSTNKDLPAIQGVAVVVAFAIMLANLLADLAYVAVDPRIRLTKAER
jgi:peptide/nickel transport system permease protein